MKRFFVWTSALLALSATTSLSQAASDSAANYQPTPAWTSGFNQGNGFYGWNVYQTGATGDPGNNVGTFFGDSKTLFGNTGPDINTNGQSFGMYGHAGYYENAERYMTSQLSANSSFSLDIAFGYVGTGNRGVDILSNSGSTIFNFGATNNAYKVQFTSSGGGTVAAASSYQAFKLYFSQTNDSGGTWLVYDSSTKATVARGDYSGILKGMHFYTTSDSNQSGDNLYFNSFSSPGTDPTPEATSSLLFSSGLLSLLGARRRKNSDMIATA